MKKLISVLLVLMLCSVFVFGRTIKITSPVSTTVVLKGDQVNITWQKLAKMNGFVKIRLFNRNGTQKVLDIANRIGNNGSFKWKYTGNVNNGDYIIRVKTLDNKDSGNSQIFKIGKNSVPPPPPPPAKKILNLKYPNGGETLSKNYQNSITWDAENLTGNMMIELWKGNRKYGTIANNIPASQKTYKWTTGNTFGNAQAPGGGDYRIKLSGNGLEDISEKYFTISDIPGIVSNNNIGNTIHTFKNPPQKTGTIAIPPTIEKIKVWSTDPKFRGQVRWSEEFAVKVLLKNKGTNIDKNIWPISIFMNGKHLHTTSVNNSKSHKKPGESWWFTISGLKTYVVSNVNKFYILKAKLQNSSKSTLIGILEYNKPIDPEINEFKIWDPNVKGWNYSGSYKPGTQFKVKYKVWGAVKGDIRNMSNNKILKSFSIKEASGGNYSIDELLLTADTTGILKLTVYSRLNKFANAEVKLNTSGPLNIGDKHLSFEMWRSSGLKIKTKGLVQGYRSVTLIEDPGKGSEKIVKKLTATEFKSASLSWEFNSIQNSSSRFSLRVTFLDYSQENKTFTIK